MKGVGASTATAVGLSRSGAVQNASAVLPLVPLGAAAGGAALGYLMSEAADKYLGDTRDYSGYTGADALKAAVAEGAMTMKSADERVMTSIKNNLANSQNVALAKGKTAIIEEMNNDASESAAVSAMQDALDSYYSTIQKNILTHWNAQMEQVNHFRQQAIAHENLSEKDLVWYGGPALNQDHSGDFEMDAVDVTLLNGDTMTIHKIYHTWTSGSSDHTPPSPYEKDAGLLVNNPSGDNFYAIKSGDYAVYTDIAAERDTVNSQLSGFASDVYAAYDPGDIPTEDLIDPVTAATEMKQNTGLASQAAEAAMLGIPTSASFSLWLELQDDDGTKYEVEAEMYTTASPTDSNGNETGWKVGTTYNPVNFDPPIYVAYEYIDTESGEKTSDFVEVEDPFTVIEATDSEGNEVTEVTHEERINQTADVTKLEDELAQLREEQRRLQEEAQSGGSFSFDSLSMLGLPGEAIALGIASVVSYLALGN